MKKTSHLALPALLLFASLSLIPQSASAHCEVPCGIYADELRFQSMLEELVPSLYS